jgi:hypothetical protein
VVALGRYSCLARASRPTPFAGPGCWPYGFSAVSCARLNTLWSLTTVVMLATLRLSGVPSQYCLHQHECMLQHTSRPRNAQLASATTDCCLACYCDVHPLCRWVWPAYWLAQGTMFWALFVVGHDCGHQSFSNNKRLNNFVGNLVHASILVPYHGWRVSHRKHHANHGHVENDESWYPTKKSHLDKMVRLLSHH